MDFNEVVRGIGEYIIEWRGSELPKIYTRKKDPEPITAKTTIRSDLFLDSLDMAEIGYGAETKYGISDEIDDSELFSAETVGDLARLICGVKGIDYPVDD